MKKLIVILVVILTVGVFLEANGIYHFGAYAVGKMAKGREASP